MYESYLTHLSHLIDVKVIMYHQTSTDIDGYPRTVSVVSYKQIVGCVICPEFLIGSMVCIFGVADWLYDMSRVDDCLHMVCPQFVVGWLYGVSRVVDWCLYLQNSCLVGWYMSGVPDWLDNMSRVRDWLDGICPESLIGWVVYVQSS